MMNPFECSVIASSHSEDLSEDKQKTHTKKTRKVRPQATTRPSQRQTYHQLSQIIPQTRPTPQPTNKRIPTIRHTRCVQQHAIEGSQSTSASSLSDSIGDGVGGWSWVAVRDPGHCSGVRSSLQYGWLARLCIEQEVERLNTHNLLI